MTDRELMRQVLDAFGGLLTFNPSPAEYQQGRASVAALRDRMSQPEPLFSTPDVTPEVTPHVIDCPRCGHCCPQWVGLTEDEIALIVGECAASHRHDDFNFAREIEAKLREKNGG